ncbi:uncharacterized protein LOC141652600 [Silene latifolia]|uniref:uncharacterized protein LOC141652600 n=1 Tax=Silene latifolia TaxID=37657 RepID=UPI003D778E9E
MTSPPSKTLPSAATTTATSAVDTVKFLCSYSGKIIPRPADGQLRYVGGLTRLISVPRSISFSELAEKLQELCGFAATPRCQLPTEDLDVLVTIKSDEDLANVIEEYDKASENSGKEMKIRAILSPPKSQFRTSASTPASPISSPRSSPDLTSYTADLRRWSHRKPQSAAMMPPIDRNIPRRVYQYKVVGDCYHNYYPSHMQSNSRRGSSFYYSPQHSNLWH